MTNYSRLVIDQILVLVAKDFKIKYDSTFLGFGWTIAVPILMSLIYYLVFGIMMRWGDVHNYLLYLISGNFLWAFFSAVVNQSGTVMLRNASLLKKTNFNRGLLVWAIFYTEGLQFLLTIPVLIGVMAFFRVVPNWWLVVNVSVAILALMFLAVGMGYLYAALNLVFRDLQRIFAIIMMMWMYCSPVFIPITRIPRQFLTYYELNPMCQILMLWRDSFWEPSFDFRRTVIALPVSVLVFLVGRLVFRKIEPRFAELV